MTDYKAMYLLLFNAVTDALEKMDRQNYGEASALLIAAQRQEQESALAESDARANALEAALLIRVDAHELWHDAGDNDA